MRVNVYKTKGGRRRAIQRLRNLRGYNHFREFRNPDDPDWPYGLEYSVQNWVMPGRIYIEKEVKNGS